jgi:hypothetical protein
MKIAAVLLALAVPFGASAGQPMVSAFGSFDSGDTCYSWNGGHKSAGSFSKCSTPVIIAIAPAPTPAPLAAAPTPNPVMVPMQTCAPPPKATRHIVKKKPAVKC